MGNPPDAQRPFLDDRSSDPNPAMSELTSAPQPRPLRRRAQHLWLVLAALVTACVANPVTGRLQYFSFSVEEDTPLGQQAFQEVLTTERVVSSGPDAQMVKRVMDRLVAVSEDLDPGFEWDVVLLDNPQMVNAFCLPGGKMAVYTGILPVCQDETGLAVVMGHEISHALARHGAERVSQEQFKTGMLDLGSSLKPEWGTYFEAGRLGLDVLVSLPWGREQELEADEIGLILMNRAGYSPQAAVEFWGRMQSMTGGGGDSMVDQWLSTHPSNQKRIEHLSEVIATLPAQS